MVVKIRLARFGRTNSPFYNIVVMQARTARNSRPMEVLGTYDPTPRKDAYQEAVAAKARSSKKKLTGGAIKAHKDVQLDVTRAKYWIGVGAQPLGDRMAIIINGGNS